MSTATIPMDNWNGDKLESLVKILVAKRWKDFAVVNFKVNGNLKVYIEPNPTANQPGNGIVKFPNELGYAKPSWNELKATLNARDFPGYYDDFRKKRMSQIAQGDVSTDKKFQACFLFLFEVARRIENSRNCPTQDDTRKAIDIVVKAPTYNDLLDMLTMPARYGDFSARYAAYENVKTKSRESYNVLTSLYDVTTLTTSLDELSIVEDEDEPGKKVKGGDDGKENKKIAKITSF